MIWRKNSSAVSNCYRSPGSWQHFPYAQAAASPLACLYPRLSWVCSSTLYRVNPYNLSCTLFFKNTIKNIVRTFVWNVSFSVALSKRPRLFSSRQSNLTVQLLTNHTLKLIQQLHFAGSVMSKMADGTAEGGFASKTENYKFINY